MPIKWAWGLEAHRDSTVDTHTHSVPPHVTCKVPVPPGFEPSAPEVLEDVPTSPTAIEAWLDTVPAHGSHPSRRYIRRLAPLTNCPSANSALAHGLNAAHFRARSLDATEPSQLHLYSPTTSGSASSDEEIRTESCASPTDSEESCTANVAQIYISEPAQAGMGSAHAAYIASESPRRGLSGEQRAEHASDCDRTALICSCSSFCDRCALHWDRSIHETHPSSSECAHRCESDGEDHAASDGGGTGDSDRRSVSDTGIFSLTQIGGGVSSTCLGISTSSADVGCQWVDPFPKPFGWAGWRRGELLGRGAHGSVFLAVEEGPEARTAAAKVISLACSVARADESRNAAHKLQVEVDLLRRLRRHEHIVE